MTEDRVDHILRTSGRAMWNEKGTHLQGDNLCSLLGLLIRVVGRDRQSRDLQFHPRSHRDCLLRNKGDVGVFLVEMAF